MKERIGETEAGESGAARRPRMRRSTSRSSGREALADLAGEDLKQGKIT